MASISKRTDGYYVTHVEGASTPMVNDTDVGMEAHKLQDKDMLELAGIKIQFFYK